MMPSLMGHVTSCQTRPSAGFNKGDLAAYWLDMVKNNEAPVSYNKLSFMQQEDYCKTMEGNYPWLQLCEGHWKVRQLWISNWKGSRYTTTNPQNPAGKSTGTSASSGNPHNQKSLTPIEILSDTEDSLPTPRKLKTAAPIKTMSEESSSSSLSKHKSKNKGNPDPSPVKKQKGKGKEVVMPNFHPEVPLPKGKNLEK